MLEIKSPPIYTNISKIKNLTQGDKSLDLLNTFLGSWGEVKKKNESRDVVDFLFCFVK